MAEQPRHGHPGHGGHPDHGAHSGPGVHPGHGAHPGPGAHSGSGAHPDDDITLAAALRDLAGQGQGLAAPAPATEITGRGDRMRRRRFAVLAAAAVVVFGGVSGVLVGVADRGDEGVRPAGRPDGPAPLPAPSSGDSPGPTTVPSASGTGAPPPTLDASGSAPVRTYPPAGTESPTEGPVSSSGAPPG
ncbi:hypothetical protein [Streptomyces silvensis]|uniref:Uncharacterized protein n=1 Tax=Streptomyces silvensis TaxID=1765722 RepID=A0A0W7XAE5_9ACTN|nr:hypothetical protein [Streptomyces silvensis]KUF19777.1 hypothetical protein AT728_05375 [Streptomyces silvensis]